jgi:hypothetical protein
MKEQAMTVRDLAKELEVRLSTAYGYLWDGTIKAEKKDGAWFVDANSVRLFKTTRSRKFASRHAVPAEVQA